MFPLQENDESLFEDLPVLIQEDKLLEDLLAEHVAASEGNASDFTSADAKKKKRKDSVNVSSVVNEETKGEGSSTKESKKIMHKVVERQRRQEMAGLYGSLRSLLPLEYIKGKRSVSDHMHEAVKYIKDMQMKIEGMQMRKDKLKNLYSLSSGVEEQANVTDFVKVNLSGEEVEVLIRSGEGFNLSKVLLELLGQGLDVISCLSTRLINDNFIHKILIQASSLTSNDLSELQQRLACVIRMG